jgi:UDP-GlcNAc:undecaprenyl-phosphate GlcNAc-1-phosphate transferase
MELILIFSTGIFALIFSLVSMPFIIHISHKFNWYDRPGKRKIHKELIPRLGGVGIFLAFLLSIVIVPIGLHLFFDSSLPHFLDLKYISIFISFSLIYFLGLLDDFYDLRAIFKLLIQIFAAAIVTVSGFVVTTISLPYIGEIDIGILKYPITILWIVGITNALNLVDGMDGLCGGITAFAALSMGIISLIQPQMQVLPAVMAFALFGSVMGFLKYNFPPAKIFMGDSGSLFLGFILAVLPLVGISGAASVTSLLVPITILMIPIIDTSAAIIRRVRMKKSIASPDKEHIHHKLLALGLSEKKILFVIYMICAYLSTIAITTVILPPEIPVYITIIVWVGLLFGYGLLNLIQSKKRELQKSKSEEEKNKKYIL